MTHERRRSFGKGLFFGDIAEDLVFPYPHLPHAEKERLRRLLDEFRDFARGAIDPRRIDGEGRIPEGVLLGLRRLGLFGLVVPAAHGGMGLSATATCRLFQEVAAVDAAVAILLQAHLSLGCRAVVLFGSEEQKRRYLPRLARGESLAAFCLTEPLSGSDAASVRTRAAYRAGGAGDGPVDNEAWIVNGSKTWVMNGGRADLFVLFAQTEVIRDGARVDRITGFLVERGMGVRPGAEDDKLGVRGASSTALYLDDVRVPRDNVLGAVGGGFKVAMQILNHGRLSLAAGCVGAARELLRLSLQHATSRRQFGRLLASFGMIKDKLAQMQLDIFAAESMVYLTTGLVDADADAGGSGSIDFSVESACCKVFASEMLWRVVNEAQQIAAGFGFVRDYPYERFLRDSRANLVFMGTSEILRCYIALTGMQGPGEQLAKLADAIKYPLRGYGLVMDTLIDKVKVAAYGGAAMTQHHGRLKKEAVLVEDGVEALQKGIERVLRKHGRQISEMQYVQGRVADVVMDLYAMVACVSRTSASLNLLDARRAAGEAGEAAGEMELAERELRLCRGFCNKAGARIRRTLDRFNENDDELMKAIADDSYHGRPYPFDAVLD